MGNKGNNRHVKRLASNRYVHVERKVCAYISKPTAGRHSLDSSIAIATVLSEKLNLSSDMKESKRIVNAGSVEVNGKLIKNVKFPVGFGDVLHFIPSNEYFRIIVARKGSVSTEKIEKWDGRRVAKVIGKYKAKGNMEMVKLYDGSVLQSIKGVKVNDSVSIINGKADRVIKLEKGAKCLVINGLHASESGIISNIKPGTALRAATVEIEGDAGKAETLLENVMAIGRE